MVDDFSTLQQKAQTLQVEIESLYALLGAMVRALEEADQDFKQRVAQSAGAAIRAQMADDDAQVMRNHCLHFIASTLKVPLYCVIR
ncbi:hypothetical protein AB4037_12280 [Labrys sp. KB_33_2]|uniref:hypothetical protein n=1 Tax=unclassified Labrys (in: a-proteobacteria) TaxID=2688601 RepID=UPI003EC0F641